tara:strand:- start:19596 stop:20540 length:945 start_codon:yes stop_codon:yes gene_type:complete
MSEAAIDAGATEVVETPAIETQVEVKPDEKAPTAPAILGGEADEKPVIAPADWPEDWRQKMVGDDEKLLKRFARYGSPKDLANALVNAQNKISSGELKAGKPADASPEQLAEWRKANGIPDTPDKYDLTLPDGLVIGEADKPLVGEVLAAAHAADASPEVVKAVVAAYYKTQDAQAAKQADSDANQREETMVALRQEWGNEYTRNVNIVNGYLGSLPDGLGGKIAGSRGPDGLPLGNDPAMARWLAGLAREANPLASVISGAGDKSSLLADEIASFKTKMGDKSSDYWKGPNAEKNQARYRELLEAESKSQGKK